MKTIQLTFLFEDTGFCKDVFQSVNQPYYYCNRDTVDGTWYTSTPDDYQNDCRIRKDVIIEIISDGQVIALDGNGDFEGKKPFIPFCTFRERLAQEFLDKHPGLHGYEDMKQKLLFLPGGSLTPVRAVVQITGFLPLILGMKPNRSWNLPTGWAGSTTSSLSSTRTSPPALYSQIIVFGRRSSSRMPPAMTFCFMIGKKTAEGGRLWEYC